MSAMSISLDEAHRTLKQNPLVGRMHPPTPSTSIGVLRWDCRSGLIHEYAQFAWGVQFRHLHASCAYL